MKKKTNKYKYIYKCIYKVSKIGSRVNVLIIECQGTFATLYIQTHYAAIYGQILQHSQWPSGLRLGFAADSLLGLGVRIWLGAQMFASFECCVSGRGLCDGSIPRPEKSYRG